MARAKLPPEQCEMLVRIPRSLRQELEQIRAAQGLTISQQVRTSLVLWVAKCHKVPAQTLFARGMGGHTIGTATEPASAYTKGKPAAYDPGPEPDQKADPGAWAKWSARAGNAAIAKLAAGEWDGTD